MSEDRDALRAKEARAVEQLDRAQQAKALKENPLLAQAIAAIRAKALADFQACALDDAETMKACRFRVHVLAELTRDLNTHIDTGKLAERELGFVRSMLDKLKRAAG